MLTDKQVAEAWLASLYGTGPPGQIGVWLRNEDNDKKRTALLRKPADINKLTIGERENVYFRVSLLDHDFIPPFRGSRGLKEDTGAVVAFGADLDIAAPERKGKKNLPPDFETVMKIVDALPFRPSRLIDSGRGVHAYWVFSSTVELINEQEIDRAAELAELFHRSIVIPAVNEVGAYDVDSVFDLPRVLRLPGFKHIATGRTVSEIHGPKGGVYGGLYDYEELTAEVERIAAEIAKRSGTPATATGKAPAVDADGWDLTRQPQYGVIETLKKNTRFLQILKNKAADLPSASEVDFAVACICLNLEIDNEEIARVLVWIRAEMGANPKRGSHGALVEYYQMTIANAKKRRGEQDQVTDVLQRIKAEREARTAPAKPAKQSKSTDKTKKAPAEPTTPLSEVMRDVAMETLRRELGLPLARVLKYHSHRPLYELHFDDADIPVECTIEDLITPKNFQARVAAVTDKLVPSFGRKDWNNLASLLLSVVERADLDLTTKTQLEEWLNDYLEHIPPSTWDDRANAYPRPFYMAERPARVAVSVANFATFIRRQGLGSYSTGDIRIRMTQASWKQTRITFPKLTKKTETTPDQERYLWTFTLSGFWRDRANEAIEERAQAEREQAQQTKKQDQRELNDDDAVDVPF